MSARKERPRSASPGSWGSPEGERRPLHPYLVLLVAVLLPGVGQVLNRVPTRGLMMDFFTVLLGWVTFHLTPPERSFVGRYAGGIFVYAMSILDAYQGARYRWEYFKRHGSTQGRGK